MPVGVDVTGVIDFAPPRCQPTGSVRCDREDGKAAQQIKFSTIVMVFALLRYAREQQRKNDQHKGDVFHIEFI